MYLNNTQFHLSHCKVSMVMKRSLLLVIISCLILASLMTRQDTETLPQPNTPNTILSDDITTYFNIDIDVFNQEIKPFLTPIIKDQKIAYKLDEVKNFLSSCFVSHQGVNMKLESLLSDDNYEEGLTLILQLISKNISEEAK